MFASENAVKSFSNKNYNKAAAPEATSDVYNCLVWGLGPVNVGGCGSLNRLKF